MKQVVQHINQILLPAERKKALLLIWADAVVHVTDIASLALLVALVHRLATGISLPANLLPLTAAALLVLLFAIKNLAAYWIQQQEYRFVYMVATRLSRQQLQQYLHGDYEQYSQTNSAVHIHHISQQPVELAHYVLFGLQQIATQTILLLIATLALLWWDAKLLLWVAIILVPAGAIALVLVKKRIQSARLQTQQASEQTLQTLREALQAYPISNINQLHDFFTNRYSNWQQQLNRQLAHLQSIQLIPQRLMEVFAVGGFVTVALLAGKAGNSYLTIGAFVAAAYRILPALVKIITASTQVKAYRHTINALQVSATASSSVAQQPLTGISLQNICFSRGDKQILQNVSATIAPGDMVGITGISGKGKTTLLHLLLGFLQPQSGRVVYSNNPAPATAFWQSMSYVPQQPFVLHDSIATNIAPGTTLPNINKVQEVLAAAGWPGKDVQTTITEAGQNISGGQQQRLAFARALYKNANLLILDEPFSELDEAAEIKLLQYCQQLAANGTMIVLVTHNPNSLLLCNKIINLHD